jgi:signal peptidase II
LSASAPPSEGAIKRRFLLLALAVLALDQWTKWLVESHLPTPSSREIIPGFFHLSHVKNTGVAFGLLADLGEAGAAWLLALLGLAAIAVVIVYFRRTPAHETGLLTALALVLGGAVGNLLDRITNGAVTDFLGVYIGSYRWPDFNVADSAISIGLVLLLLDSFRTRPSAAAPVGERP